VNSRRALLVNSRRALLGLGLRAGFGVGVGAAVRAGMGLALSPGLRVASKLAAGAATTLWPDGPAWALPPRAMAFPRDHGAHPDLRTEWWYITGALRDASGRAFGFQVTFFRSRVDGTEGLRSRLAARQLVFAHAAITDVANDRLWHDQRIARAGSGGVIAATDDADLRLRDWRLWREGGRWRARIEAAEFQLELDARPTQPVLLQGQAGLSRKGPDPIQASYYYSEPQLAARVRLRLVGAASGPSSASATTGASAPPATPQTFALDGTAWMDHEWSEALLHPRAVGWDWIGMNLEGGGALTAFRLRTQAGETLWDGGSLRSAEGTTRIFEPGETRWQPLRHWTSPRTQTRYPVQWQVDTPAGRHVVRPRLDDQELDSRGSTGAVYWEGLSELLDPSGRVVGQGYLEMTGYAGALRL
jgi:predicted secreted hydrolase